MAVVPHAGELTERVELQSAVQAADPANDLNERDLVYTTFKTVWAQFLMLRGRELVAQGQMQVSAEARFRIRYRPDVTAHTRLVHKGKAWDVVGEPIILGRSEFLELMCVSGSRQR